MAPSLTGRRFSILIDRAFLQGPCPLFPKANSDHFNEDRSVVAPPERRKVPAEIQFEFARKTVTEATYLGTARLRTGQGQG